LEDKKILDNVDV